MGWDGDGGWAPACAGARDGGGVGLEGGEGYRLGKRKKEGKEEGLGGRMVGDRLGRGWGMGSRLRGSKKRGVGKGRGGGV